MYDTDVRKRTSLRAAEAAEIDLYGGYHAALTGTEGESIFGTKETRRNVLTQEAKSKFNISRTGAVQLGV